jgi:hypothetical protein
MPNVDSAPIYTIRNWLWPAFLLGFLAALVGSTILVSSRSKPSMTMWAFVSGSLLFAACFLAVRAAPMSRLKAFGTVIGGAATGVAIHALVHAGLFGGSRNLWPMEVVLFVLLGGVPGGVGAVLGSMSKRIDS